MVNRKEGQGIIFKWKNKKFSEQGSLSKNMKFTLLESGKKGSILRLGQHVLFMEYYMENHGKKQRK